MSRATDAADAIRRAAKKYELFVDAAKILEEIGSLEQAVAEADKAKGIALEARAAAETASAAAEAARAKLIKDGETMRSDAEQSVAKILQASHERANVEAKAIVKAAMDEAISVHNEANAKVQRATAELSGLQAQIKIVQTERDALSHQVSAAKATLAEVQERLAEVQAQAKRLFNAA